MNVAIMPKLLEKKMEINEKNKNILLNQALKIDPSARLIKNVKSGYRKDNGLGSTYSPSKFIIFKGKRWSVGGARQYFNGNSYVKEISDE
tara:strand:+ start:19 stop:288 length:270 start_codon:yes stop_codon:yes gene_type:complete